MNKRNYKAIDKYFSKMARKNKNEKPVYLIVPKKLLKKMREIKSRE